MEQKEVEVSELDHQSHRRKMITTKEDQLLLIDAIQLATKYHGNALSQDGTAYILHPLRLMMKAETTAQKIVAILHDTIEDTDLTLDELSKRGFTENIIHALDCLSRRKSGKNGFILTNGKTMESYDDFIERIATDELATYVKLLDLRDNIDLTRLTVVGEYELKRAAKYHRAIIRLTGVY